MKAGRHVGSNEIERWDRPDLPAGGVLRRTGALGLAHTTRVRMRILTPWGRKAWTWTQASTRAAAVGKGRVSMWSEGDQMDQPSTSSSEPQSGAHSPTRYLAILIMGEVGCCCVSVTGVGGGGVGARLMIERGLHLGVAWVCSFLPNRMVIERLLARWGGLRSKGLFVHCLPHFVRRPPLIIAATNARGTEPRTRCCSKDTYETSQIETVFVCGVQARGRARGRQILALFDRSAEGCLCWILKSSHQFEEHAFGWSLESGRPPHALLLHHHHRTCRSIETLPAHTARTTHTGGELGGGATRSACCSWLGRITHARGRWLHNDCSSSPAACGRRR